MYSTVEDTSNGLDSSEAESSDSNASITSVNSIETLEAQLEPEIQISIQSYNFSQVEHQYHNPIRGRGILLDMRQALHRFFTFPYNLELNVPKLELANSGFFLNAQKNAIHCHFCELSITETIATNNVDSKHRELSPNCPLLINPNECGNCVISDTTSFTFESRRLFSFLITTWTAPVTPYDLANSGFYWTGTSDNCKCAFCRLEIRNWEANETADGEHRRWNSNCAFLAGRNVRNVPIGFENNQSLLVHDIAGHRNIAFDNLYISSETQSAGSLMSHVYMSDMQENITSIEQLGITPISIARHPEYALFYKRLNSFQLWPMCLSQRPEELAETGFYYTGNGDRVICFQCGGGLKDWAPNDIPWEEHIKWFPECPYILMKARSIHFMKIENSPKMAIPAINEKKAQPVYEEDLKET